jgi:hypothetical protein
MLGFERLGKLIISVCSAGVNGFHRVVRWLARHRFPIVRHQLVEIHRNEVCICVSLAVVKYLLLINNLVQCDDSRPCRDFSRRIGRGSTASICGRCTQECEFDATAPGD